jgi:periplasmic copper chaperone A
MKKWITAALLSAALATAAQGQAPTKVSVERAWARASVQGQASTGAYLTLTAAEPMTLVGVSTPVAAVAELHEMKMEGDVMRMRAVDGVPLPAGRPVELKPGGHHIMLMQLHAPLRPGTSIPLTLLLKNAAGASVQVQASLTIAAQAPVAGHPASGR